MSIETYDVEPVDHRVFFRWLSGGLAAVTGVLAVIGWPLPTLPGRYVHTHAWERTVALIQAWSAHDGWRMSGASWFWGGVAIAATTGALVLRHRSLGVRGWLLVLGPGAVVAALGPLGQVAAGVPWSNYTPTHDTWATVVVYVTGLVVAVALPFLRAWVMRGRDQPPTAAGDG